MRILILAAGKNGVNLSQEGYPLWLTEFDGRPLLEHLVERCSPLNADEILIALPQSEISEFHLDNVVSLLGPNISLVPAHGITQGATCTALLAIDQINTDGELVVLNGDELVDASFVEAVETFRVGQFDAGTVLFPSIHPRYSYARIDDDGLVIEIAEKRPISKNATVGFYWFQRGSDFVEAAKAQIRKGASIGGDYYISPTMNELILHGKRVGSFRVKGSDYHPLKTDVQVASYEIEGERQR